MKIIRVNKDLEYSIISHTKYNYSNKDLMLLIPMDTNIADLYIPIKASKFLDFDNVEIKYELSGIVYDYEFEKIDDFSNINIQTLHISSIIELVNFLHTIYKINYYNEYMEESNLFNGLTSIEFIMYRYFEIKIYKNKKVIFHAKYNKKLGIVNIDNVLDYSYSEIISKLSPLFEYPSEYLDDKEYVKFGEKIIMFKHNFSSSCMCGYILPRIRLMLFITNDDHEKLKNITNIVSDFNILDKNDLIENDMFYIKKEPIDIYRYEAFLSVKYSTVDFLSCVEYLIGINTIIVYKLFSYNFLVFEVDKNNKYTNPDFIITNELSIMIGKKEYKLYITSSNLNFNLVDLIRQL